MHKETLKTNNSSNPEDNLLDCANENEVFSPIAGQITPEAINGWMNQDKMFSSDEIKFTPRVSFRRKSSQTHCKTSRQGSSVSKESNIDTLKLKLNEYLGGGEEQSIELSKKSQEECFEGLSLHDNSRTLNVDKEDFVKGRKLKGFEKKSNMKLSKSHNKSASIVLNNYSVEKRPVNTVNKTLTSFRMKSHKNVSVVSYPLNVDFPSEEEEAKLSSRLNYYLKTHKRLRQFF